MQIARTGVDEGTAASAPISPVGFSYDHLVGFGEAMLRLSASPGQTLETAPSLSVHVGGAELNGLIAATGFGMPSVWVSAVGNDSVGRRIARHARSHGVTTSLTISDDARSGLYFVEMGVSPRSTRVVYDRSSSAASLVDKGSIDWPSLVTENTCLYSSGITAGISAASRQSLEEGISYARSVGAAVAIDINYRQQLWTTEDAYRWTSDIMSKVDILSVSDADLLSLGQRPDDLASARENLGVGMLVVTSKKRMSEVVSVTICAIDERGQSRAAREATVVDPLGAGDAMFGAFLATAPSEGREVAVDNALRAALLTYGVDGDAMDIDPYVMLEGGRILR